MTTSSSVTVRRATTADAAALVPLLGELGYPSSPTAVARRLAELLAAPANCVLVAESEAVVAGVAAMHLMPLLNRDGMVGWITAMVVSEEKRGRGVGAALLRALERFALEQGVSRVLVSSAENRAGAHRFYEREGYAYTGRRFAKMLSATGEGR
jgi:GNAT superfamily N-acetyltransferase